MPFTLDKVVPWVRSFEEYTAMFALSEYDMGRRILGCGDPELCRVANEVRVFPLLELGAKKSRHLASLFGRLEKDGYTVKIETVPYEFQRGGNQMLRVARL